jgi:LmbE family N-acetylglucosaminyl deacetylase
MGNILAIISHPDDETFGCGGTLALHASKGHDVGVLCLTCSPSERRSELERAASILGVDEPIIFPEERLTDGPETIRRISDVIVERRPEVVLTHVPFDYHREHRLAHELVKEAVEWAAHTTTYEEPWLVERLLLVEINTLIPTPQILVDISDVYDLKAEAIEAYKSQVAKFDWKYYQRFDRSKAELRGVQGNCRYAEAFIEEALPRNSPFYADKTTRSLF